MAQLNGERVCGKRAKKNFVTSVRPDVSTNACPDGYTHCGTIPGLSASETIERYKDNIICVPFGSGAECPITDIKFVPGDGQRNSTAE